MSFYRDSAYDAVVTSTLKNLTNLALPQGHVATFPVSPSGSILYDSTYPDTIFVSDGSAWNNISTGSSPFTHIDVTDLTDQITLGTTNTTTLNAPTTVTKTVTIPDVGVAVNVVLSSNSSAASQLLVATGVNIAHWVDQSTISINSFDASPPLTIANGGTNSSSALTNGKIMVSTAGAIVEGTSSTTPTFTSETLTATTNQVVLGTTNTTTINSVAPSANRIYTIRDASRDGAFVINTATDTGSIVVGQSTANAVATTVVLGVSASSSDPLSVAVGNSAIVSGNSGTAVGASAQAALDGTAIGKSAVAIPGCIALGKSAITSAAQSVMIGTGLTNSVANSVRIGANALELVNFCDAATGNFTRRLVTASSGASPWSPTATQLLGGVLKNSTAGTFIVITPTGTDLDLEPQLAGNLYVGMSFDAIFVPTNALGQAQLANVAGITKYGPATGAAGAVMRVTFTRTGANAWDAYIVVTP